MNKQAEIITAVIDEVTTFEHLNNKQKNECLSLCLDILNDYPKPQKEEKNTTILQAWACVENIRFTCNLCLSGSYGFGLVYTRITERLETALTLLLV